MTEKEEDKGKRAREKETMIFIGAIAGIVALIGLWFLISDNWSQDAEEYYPPGEVAVIEPASSADEIIRDCFEMLKTGDIIGAENKFFDEYGKNCFQNCGGGRLPISQILAGYSQHGGYELRPAVIAGDTATIIIIDHQHQYNNAKFYLARDGSTWKIHSFEWN